MEEPIKNTTPQEPSQKHRHASTYVLIALVIILLAVVGWLAWQWKLCLDTDAKTADQNKQLQAKVDDLTKKLADASKPSTSTNTNTTTPCTPTISQSLKDNIHDAISSKNTAALEGYMASSVNVVIAASEKGGSETAAQAVADLDYLNNNATSPWNFSLPDATINNYKAHFYKQYFEGTVYVGKSANSYVVSFGFDCNGKINQVFMAASEDLLTQ